MSCQVCRYYWLCFSIIIQSVFLQRNICSALTYSQSSHSLTAITLVFVILKASAFPCSVWYSTSLCLYESFWALFHMSGITPSSLVGRYECIFSAPRARPPSSTWPYIKKVVSSAEPRRGEFLGKDLTKCLLSGECLTGAWTDPQKQHRRTHWLSLCGLSERCASNVLFLKQIIAKCLFHFIRSINGKNVSVIVSVKLGLMLLCVKQFSK